jgi:hypothetical protein
MAASTQLHGSRNAACLYQTVWNTVTGRLLLGPGLTSRPK